jgi:hypothetical protein
MSFPGGYCVLQVQHAVNWWMELTGRATARRQLIHQFGGGGIPVVTIARLHELSFEVDARGVVFWDDNTLLLTTPSAEVWRAVVAPTPGKAELSVTAKHVLGPVAQALGQADVKPASGGYPRLAASTRAGAVVVNTHDLVLVACPMRGGNGARLLSFGWGQYYPAMAFSRDGTRFYACADHLLVFDTGSWQGQARDALQVCAWHPSEPLLLGLHEYTGQLGWTDWSDGANPTLRPVGTLAASEGRIEPAGIVVDASGERCVTAYRQPDRLEWWQLDPLRLIDCRLVGEGEVLDLQSGPGTGWFAVESEAGVQLWDFETREPLSDVIAGASGVQFSPSGLRFVTQSRSLTNPYPIKPGGADRAVTLWKVAA